MNTTVKEKKVVLVGITGAGKSSLVNLIIRENKCKTSNRVKSQTKEAQMESIEHNGTKFTIVDTIGLSDTEDSQIIVRSKITDAVKKCILGVDIFLLVVKMGRILETDQIAFDYLMRGILGEKSLSNAILVITHADPDMVAGPDADRRQREWIEDAKDNQFVRELLHDISYRCQFVCNPPTSSVPAMETAQDQFRQQSREDLLQSISQFQTTPYRIESVLKVQQDYDAKMIELQQEKERAATEEQRKLIQQAIDQEKQKFDNEINRLTTEHLKKMQEIQKKQRKKGRGLFSKIGKILDELIFE